MTSNSEVIHSAVKRAFRGSVVGLHKEPTEAARLNTGVPAEFQRILDEAIDKDRDLRYNSAAELRNVRVA